MRHLNLSVFIEAIFEPSLTAIETSTPQQAGGFIIKHYFGISNIAAYRWKRVPIASLPNNQYPIMFHYSKIYVSYWLSHNN